MLLDVRFVLAADIGCQGFSTPELLFNLFLNLHAFAFHVSLLQ